MHNYRYLWLELAAWHRFWTAPVPRKELNPSPSILYPIAVAFLIAEFWVVVYISGLMRPL